MSHNFASDVLLAPISMFKLWDNIFSSLEEPNAYLMTVSVDLTVQHQEIEDTGSSKTMLFCSCSVFHVAFDGCVLQPLSVTYFLSSHGYEHEGNHDMMPLIRYDGNMTHSAKSSFHSINFAYKQIMFVHDQAIRPSAPPLIVVAPCREIKDTSFRISVLFCFWSPFYHGFHRANMGSQLSNASVYTPP